MATSSVTPRSAECQAVATLEFIQSGELQAADCPARDLLATMRRLVLDGADILAVSYTAGDGSFFSIIPICYDKRGIPTSGLVERCRSANPGWLAILEDLRQRETPVSVVVPLEAV